MSDIKVGSVVYLKSNQEVSMTVESIQDGIAWCTWLDKSHKRTDGHFALTSLELDEGPLMPSIG